MSQSVLLSGQRHSWGSAGCWILTVVTQTYGKNPKAEWAKELVRREQEQPESEDGFKAQGGENLLRRLCIRAQMGSLSATLSPVRENFVSRFLRIADKKLRRQCWILMLQWRWTQARGSRLRLCSYFCAVNISSQGISRIVILQLC